MKFKLLIIALTVLLAFNAYGEDGDVDLSFYTGTFDVIGVGGQYGRVRAPFWHDLGVR